jgi:glycosyltransferase involved in cell wall biosynthesis
MADKILSLLDDAERRRAMGNFGRLRVANELSWDHEVPKLLAAYDAAFEPQKKPASSGSGDTRPASTSA